MTNWIDKGVPMLQTSLGREELSRRLRSWEPWSSRIDFSNGVSTKDFRPRAPFSEYPLTKLKIVAQAIPFAELAEARVLDIGCNVGYNSIAVSVLFGLSCVGFDVVPRHIEAARFLAEVAGVNTDFTIASAESFRSSHPFDVALHFGTLYHLQNPLLSLRLTFENLRPGGYLALETQVYDHPDDRNICYFMHMQNQDQTNFWALSTTVLEITLRLIGFGEVRQLKKVVPALGLAQHMSRIILVARKPADTVSPVQALPSPATKATPSGI